MAGRRVILTIGAADFFTDAWCNGHYLDRHEGGYTPFEFDLTEALRREGEKALTGTIVLRLEDPMNNFDQPVGKQWGWYSSASGIWQRVFVEPRAAEFVERFEITTREIGRGSVAADERKTPGFVLSRAAGRTAGGWHDDLWIRLRPLSDGPTIVK